MSRTNIAAQTPLGPFPAGGAVGAGALKINWAAADVSNHNEFILSGKEVLLVWNTDTGAHNLTLTSAPDQRGRSADVSGYSIPAGEIHAFSFRQGADGWQQTDGHVFFQADDATVKFAVLSPQN